MVTILCDLDRVSDVAQQILIDLALPFYLGQVVASIAASISIALYPQDAGKLGDLLGNADQETRNSLANNWEAAQ